MQLVERLSDTARAELRTFLNGSEYCLSYEAARGLFAAVAIMPRLLGPSHWLPIVFRGHTLEGAGNSHSMISAAQALCAEVLGQLEGADPRVCPPAEDMEGVTWWLVGFLKGASLDLQFFDTQTRAMVFEVGIILDPDLFPAASDADRIRVAQKLPALVQALYEQHQDARIRTAVSLLGTRPSGPGPRLDRNAACPCGSGRAFRSCCGL